MRTIFFHDAKNNEITMRKNIHVASLPSGNAAATENQYMTKANNTRLRSFRFAIMGLRSILHGEPNFKIQLIMAALALITAGFLGCSITEWAIILTCCAFVLAAEAMNTIVEAMIDFIHPGYHEKAGKIKDMAAAVPLIASIFAFVTGLLIFLPKLWEIFKAFII